MNVIIRKATALDVDSIVTIYNHIFDNEAAGLFRTGWIKGIYPSANTVLESLKKDDLFVFEENGVVVAAAKINHEQVYEYADCKWEHESSDDKIMVLHTLAVEPSANGRGYGKKFVQFYEDYALQNGCEYLRMDTNEINANARRLYKGLGYKEVGIVLSNFNGIEGVRLVCLEKKLR